MSYVTERAKEISTWSGASLIGLGLVIILGGPFLKLLAWAAIAWGIISIVKKQFKKHWDHIEFFSKGGTECYVLHCPKNYIVVFRGTEPTSWEDIKADIQFHKQKKEYVPTSSGVGTLGKVHRGFRDALEDIWKDLISHYNYHGNGK